MMNAMCGIDLSGLRPRRGFRKVCFAAIARCTMLLTGAPLELMYAETQNIYDSFMSFAGVKKSRAIAHFYNVETS
jgi:hypothetical protein